MARDVLMVERVGSPSAAAFETAMNALLAPLLSHLIGAFDILVTDKLPSSTRLIKGLVDTDDTGTVITHPYLVKAFEAYDDNAVLFLVEQFLAANPSYWSSPVLYRYTDQLHGIPTRSMLFLLYNVSLADGTANWDPGYIAIGGGGGGVPTGPAGGDLSGTYPNPLVGPTTRGYTAGVLAAGANTLQAVAIALYQDSEWELILFKGTTRYSTKVRANIGDGTTPVWVEDDIVISPAVGGTFDFTITVTIAGGNLNLVVTPVTSGWESRIRAHLLAI